MKFWKASFMILMVISVFTACQKNEQTELPTYEIPASVIAEMEADADTTLDNLDLETIIDQAAIVSNSEEAEKSHYWVCNIDCGTGANPAKYYGDVTYAAYDPSGGQYLYNYFVQAGMGWPAPLVACDDESFVQNYSDVPTYFYTIVKTFELWQDTNWQTIYSQGKYGPVANFGGTTSIRPGRSKTVATIVYRYIWGSGWCQIGQNYHYING